MFADRRNGWKERKYENMCKKETIKQVEKTVDLSYEKTSIELWKRVNWVVKKVNLSCDRVY